MLVGSFLACKVEWQAAIPDEINRCSGVSQIADRQRLIFSVSYHGIAGRWSYKTKGKSIGRHLDRGLTCATSSSQGHKQKIRREATLWYVVNRKEEYAVWCAIRTYPSRSYIISNSTWYLVNEYIFNVALFSGEVRYDSTMWRVDSNVCSYSTGIALYCTVQYIDRHGLILCGQHRHR